MPVIVTSEWDLLGSESMLSYLGLKKTDLELFGNVWQDRHVRFDISAKELSFRLGEILYSRLENVEDIKGNSVDKGTLLLTNLRLIWRSSARPNRLNLSIGFRTITSIKIRVAHNRLRGAMQALQVEALFANTKYEFIFAPANNSIRTEGSAEDLSEHASTPALFLAAPEVLKLYEASHLYRDMRLCGAIIRVNQVSGDKDVILLPKERIVNKTPNVWNLTFRQGNLGYYVTTNFRFIWFAAMAENFNVTIPFYLITKVYSVLNKGVPILVIEAQPRAGGQVGTTSPNGYRFGFRVEDKETLARLEQELTQLRKSYLLSPYFGVDYDVSLHNPNSNLEDSQDTTDVVMNEAEEGLVIDSTEHDVNASKGDAYARYLVDPAAHSVDKQITFCEALGLATEELPAGGSLQKLWHAL